MRRKEGEIKREREAGRHKGGMEGGKKEDGIYESIG